MQFENLAIFHGGWCGRQTPPRADTPEADTYLGRHPYPGQTATAADGVRPTGMNSCFFFTNFASDFFGNWQRVALFIGFGVSSIFGVFFCQPGVQQEGPMLYNWNGTSVAFLG